MARGAPLFVLHVTQTVQPLGKLVEDIGHEDAAR